MPHEHVWAVWPSAHPELANATARLWQEKGYKVAVLIDEGSEIPPCPDITLTSEVWEGYPRAMNRLCRTVPGPVVVCAADDIYPSEDRSPCEIQAEFLQVFPDTYGVMQPTGDRFGSIDIVCPCPWLGRAFINESYSGKGPWNPEYFHYFCDAEIQDVATLQNAFIQRPDISQYHDHWQREKGGTRPEHLMRAKARWKAGKVLYESRKKENFPGHQRGVPNGND